MRTFALNVAGWSLVILAIFLCISFAQPARPEFPELASDVDPTIAAAAPAPIAPAPAPSAAAETAQDPVSSLVLKIGEAPSEGGRRRRPCPGGICPEPQTQCPQGNCSRGGFVFIGRRGR
jgi:hypothetical protein